MCKKWTARYDSELRVTDLSRTVGLDGRPLKHH